MAPGNRVQCIILCVFLLFSAGRTPATAQSGEAGGGGGEDTIVLLPSINRGGPAFAPLLLDRLLRQELAVSDATRIKRSAIDPARLPSGGEIDELSPSLIIDFLLGAAEEENGRYALAAGIRKENNTYILSLYIADTATDEAVVSGEKRVTGVGDLDLAVEEFRDQLLRSNYPEIAKRYLDEPDEPAQETEAGPLVRSAERSGGASERAVPRREEGDGDTESREKELEALAEDDPEEALKTLPPALEAELRSQARREVTGEVKEQLRDEVKEELRPQLEAEVQEERIRQLYEAEKAQRRRERRESLAFWSAVGGFSLRSLADLEEDLAGQAALLSLRAYGGYLVGGDYQQYESLHSLTGGLYLSSYLSAGLGSSALTLDALWSPPDVLPLSPAGRVLLSYSTGIYALGRGMAVTSTWGGTYSIRALYDYQISSSNLEQKYDLYRTWHSLYTVERIAAYSLEGLGIAGTVLAFLMPGEKSSLVPSEAGRRSLSIGLGLFGAASVAGKMSANFHIQSAEAYMKEQHGGPRGVADTYSIYGYVAQALSYGLYGAAAWMTIDSLQKDTERAEEGAVAAVPSDPPEWRFRLFPAADGGVTFSTRLWW